MKQQTAVEWLQEKLNNVKPTEFCSIETIKEWVKQAKEMERDQIEESFAEGRSWDNTCLNGEYYYEETFGGEKPLRQPPVSGRREQFVCGANRFMGEKRCKRQCGQCEELYPQTNCR